MTFMLHKYLNIAILKENYFRPPRTIPAALPLATSKACFILCIIGASDPTLMLVGEGFLGILVVYDEDAAPRLLADLWIVSRILWY